MSRSDLPILENVLVRAGTLRAEMRWGVERLRDRISPRTAVEREDRLRRMLRDVPYWVRGHILLGRSLIRQIVGSRPDPRSIASLRVTGEAVSLLARARRRGKQRPGVEGRYLLAMSYFFSRDYQSAVSLFRQILALNNAVHFDRQTYLEALENGGAAALAIGDHKLAHELLTRIPGEQLSKESAAALDYLKTQNPT